MSGVRCESECGESGRWRVGVDRRSACAHGKHRIGSGASSAVGVDGLSSAWEHRARVMVVKAGSRCVLIQVQLQIKTNFIILFYRSFVVFTKLVTLRFHMPQSVTLDVSLFRERKIFEFSVFLPV